MIFSPPSTLIAVVMVFTAMPALAQSRSCIETAGSRQAARYAYECRIVAESLHAPCNAKNPCDVMIPIIREGCASIHYDTIHFPDFKAKGGKEPAFCSRYLSQP